MGGMNGFGANTSKERADALLGRKDESLSRVILNSIGGFRKADPSSFGTRGAGETTNDVISKYEQVYGKDKEKMGETPRAVYEELLKVRDEELKNNQNFKAEYFKPHQKCNRSAVVTFFPLSPVLTSPNRLLTIPPVQPRLSKRLQTRNLVAEIIRHPLPTPTAQ